MYVPASSLVAGMMILFGLMYLISRLRPGTLSGVLIGVAVLLLCLILALAAVHDMIDSGRSTGSVTSSGRFGSGQGLLTAVVAIATAASSYL